MLKEREVTAYGRKIIDDVDALVASSKKFPVAIYIEGGAYDIRFGINEFAENSLKMALDIANNIIVRHRKKIKVVLGAFVNDLGSKNKALHNRSGFLSGFNNITEGYQIYKENLFLVSFETSSKNRGIRSLKKIMAEGYCASDSKTYPNLEVEPSSAGHRVFFYDNRSRILLAETQGDNWSVKCPMLMAQHYLDMVNLIRKRVPAADTYFLIDFSEKIDGNKVENGALVASKLLLDREIDDKHIIISNHFFWDDRGSVISGSVSEFRKDALSA